MSRQYNQWRSQAIEWLQSFKTPTTEREVESLIDLLHPAVTSPNFPQTMAHWLYILANFSHFRQIKIPEHVIPTPEDILQWTQSAKDNRTFDVWKAMAIAHLLITKTPTDSSEREKYLLIKELVYKPEFMLGYWLSLYERFLKAHGLKPHKDIIPSSSEILRWLDKSRETATS